MQPPEANSLRKKRRGARKDFRMSGEPRRSYSSTSSTNHEELKIRLSKKSKLKETANQCRNQRLLLGERCEKVEGKLSKKGFRKRSRKRGESL